MSEQDATKKALFHQAVHHLNTGALDQCERLCLDIREKYPAWADSDHILALAYRAQGKLKDAERTAKRAASRDRKNPSILNSLGLILLDQDKAREAAKLFRKVLRLDDSNVAAQTNLGHAQTRLNLLSDAEKSYRRALRLQSNSVDALVQLSLLLRNSNRAGELEALIAQFPKQEAGNPGLAMVRGLAALDAKQPIEAEIQFRNALNQQPRSAQLWANYGLALYKQGKSADAESAYKTALEIAPTLPEAHINLADLLKYQSPERARTHLLEAERFLPEDKSIQDMLGFTWFLEKRFDAALDHFNRSLSIDSRFERAAYHRAGVYFLKGNLADAWKDYEIKYGVSGTTGSPVGDELPLWNPASTLDGPLLVWTDQGLGDEILQLGYIADFYKTAPVLIIATSTRLLPIAARSFPDAQVVCTTGVADWGSLSHPPAAQCPAMKLAAIRWKSLSDHPDRTPYLMANEGHAQRLRKSYLASNQNGPLIGISWKSTSADFGAQKSIRLSDLMPILEQPGCTFVNLQYGDTRGDIAGLPEHIRQKIICDDSIDPLVDMDAFADQVYALDLVLTTSNTTAHLAGALGSTTWTLVPRVGPGWLWYWFDDRQDSPWYPRMQVFRQSRQGDWSPAISSLSAEFSRFIMEFQSLTGN